MGLAPTTNQLPARDDIAYREQLGALLPRGRAWPREEGSTLMRLLHAEADELARVDARLSDLFEETDVRSTLELLGDWERVAGLPDACTPAPDSIAERRTALLSRLTSQGGQSRAYFIELAATLGFAITIDEFRPFVAGSYAGDDICGEDWAHAWRVNVLPPAIDTGEGFTVTYLCAGGNAGDYLAGYGSLDLECIINRAKPAHTTVLFSYPVEPEPLVWFDFTAD
jgi:uncharacterized protein YmfQ (DUF2313 family)